MSAHAFQDKGSRKGDAARMLPRHGRDFNIFADLRTNLLESNPRSESDGAPVEQIWSAHTAE
jgi:hypothetical protein